MSNKKPSKAAAAAAQAAAAMPKPATRAPQKSGPAPTRLAAAARVATPVLVTGVTDLRSVVAAVGTALASSLHQVDCRTAMAEGAARRALSQGAERDALLVMLGSALGDGVRAALSDVLEAGVRKVFATTPAPQAPRELRELFPLVLTQAHVMGTEP